MRSAIFLVTLGTLAGCKDLEGNQALSAGTTNPTSYDTPAGVALQVDGVRGMFGESIAAFVRGSGVFTDELTAADRTTGDAVDARRIADGVGDVTETYDSLQSVRVAAAVAISSARKFAPNLPPEQLAEMYAIQGYAEVMLADLFCSGVPLSLPRTDGDIDYRAGSSTADVYNHAIILFDSALVLAGDSIRVSTLARVGRGRAWLALGQYDSAAHAVAVVQEGDSYQVRVKGIISRRGDVTVASLYPYSAADHEGQVGLQYRSSQDPRTFADSVLVNVNCVFSVNCQTLSIFVPEKYPLLGGDSTAMIIAGSIEARLIQAEAELHAERVTSWLNMLNTLRSDGTATITTRYDEETGDSLGTDTTWNPGLGGVSGLAPLIDPGVEAARIDTMFSERAAWLYLTGHRQGDLRRLVRSTAAGGYGRPQAQVYPTGSYNPQVGAYGNDVNVPIPQDEHYNPKFSGCQGRGA